MSRFAAPLLFLLLAIALQFSLEATLGQYVERVYLNVCIAAILAVSLNIVNGYTGQFSLGHAGFFAIGGYAAAMVTYYGSILLWDHSRSIPAPESLGLTSLRAWLGTSGSTFLTQQVLFIGGSIFGGLVAAAAGWLVGLPSLRLRGDYLAIVTLGFGEIVRVLLQQTNRQLYSRDEISNASFAELVPPPVGASRGFINLPHLTSVFWATLFLGICLIFAWRLKKSTYGRAMIAIRENEIAAEAMGVNVTRLKVWAFVFAAFFAGIGGSLYAHLNYQVGPDDAGFQRSIDAVIMVVLGGLGSISGAAIAALILTVAGEWLRELGQFRMISYALALVLVMILRPRGLFGTSELSDAMRVFRRTQPPRGSEVSR
jgi:branched-chain amino acid transport system permease protein